MKVKCHVDTCHYYNNNMCHAAALEVNPWVTERLRPAKDLLLTFINRRTLSSIQQHVALSKGADGYTVRLLILLSIYILRCIWSASLAFATARDDFRPDYGLFHSGRALSGAFGVLLTGFTSAINISSIYLPASSEAMASLILVSDIMFCIL
jgi:hypothetical protein